MTGKSINKWLKKNAYVIVIVIIVLIVIGFIVRIL